MDTSTRSECKRPPQAFFFLFFHPKYCPSGFALVCVSERKLRFNEARDHNSSRGTFTLGRGASLQIMLIDKINKIKAAKKGKI